MNKISKILANEIARKLVSKSDEDFRIVRENKTNIVREYYRAGIPDEIFKK